VDANYRRFSGLNVLATIGIANLFVIIVFDHPAEQETYHGGLFDKFVEFTGPTDPGCTDFSHKKLVMGYYDGNTVTAIWNYAQHLQ
jgi:hypothetical protein